MPPSPSRRVEGNINPGVDDGPRAVPSSAGHTLHPVALGEHRPAGPPDYPFDNPFDNYDEGGGGDSIGPDNPFDILKEGGEGGDESLRMTFGKGVTNPVGDLFEARGEGLELAIAEELMADHRNGTGSWFSLSIYKDNHRKNGNWLAASGITLDIDYYKDGERSSIPEDILRAGVARCGFANITFPTPRGFRALFLYDRMVDDRKQHLLAVETVMKRVQKLMTLNGPDVPVPEVVIPDGALMVDFCSRNLSQLFYTPKALVGGERRTSVAEVHFPFRIGIEALTEMGMPDDPGVNPSEPVVALQPVGPETEAITTLAQANRALQEAILLYNEANAREWPMSGGRCPACGHDGCFGAMPDDPSRWVCFSTQHEKDSGGVGIEGDGCWHGDALDLGAHERGVHPVRILVEEGYLDLPKEGLDEFFGPKPEVTKRVERAIIVVREGAENYDEAASVLNERADVELFERGGTLVKVAGNGNLSPVGKAELEELLAKHARWVEELKRPPAKIVQNLASNPGKRFRSVSGVVTSPVLLKDGSVVDRPGYSAKSGLYFSGNPSDWPAIPASPTFKDAQEALQTLQEAVCDFPFREECDRVAAIAEVLTVVGRHAIDGPVPIFCNRATTPGSGKTLLARVTGFIGLGREPSISPWPFSEAEQEKKVLALAMEGSPLCVLDNLTGAVNSKVLAAAVTSGTWSGRVLGESRTAHAPLGTVFIITGNNIQIEGDLNRRVIPVDLLPKEENPQERTGFRHPDLKAWTMENRGRLVVAAITILREFILSGRPVPEGLTPFGSFEAWSDLIRGALVRLGMQDPYLGNQRIREYADPQRDRLQGLFEAWNRVIGNRPVKVREVLDLANQDPELADAVRAMTRRKDAFLPSSGQLGKALTEFVDRPVAGYRLRRAMKHKGQWLYELETLKPPSPPTPSGGGGGGTGSSTGGDGGDGGDAEGR